MITRRASVIVAALLGLATLAVSPGAARAQINDRNFYVGFGAGFGLDLQAGGGAYFRGEENVGYHVLNVNRHPGLFVGATVSQFAASSFALVFDAQVGFDFLIWDGQDMGFLLTPSVGFGVDIGFAAGGTLAFFHMQPGLTASFSLVDGLVQIYWRPLGFDILVGNGGSAAGYLMMGGVNFNF